MAYLLLDLYGTLLPLPSDADRARIEELSGTNDPERFWSQYEEMRPVLDVGESSFERWWRLLVARAGLPNPDLASLAAADVAAGVTGEWKELIDGVRHSIVANLPFPHARAVREHYQCLQEADAVVFSCDVALALPDERLFAVALDAMEAKAADTIFVSRNAHFVDAAVEAGLHGVVMTDDLDLQELAWSR